MKKYSYTRSKCCFLFKLTIALQRTVPWNNNTTTVRAKHFFFFHMRRTNTKSQIKQNRNIIQVDRLWQMEWPTDTHHVEPALASLSIHISLYLFHSHSPSLSLLWMRSSGWLLMAHTHTKFDIMHWYVWCGVCSTQFVIRCIHCHAPRPLISHPFTKWRKTKIEAGINRVSAWIVSDLMSNFVLCCRRSLNKMVFRSFDSKCCGFL